MNTNLLNSCLSQIVRSQELHARMLNTFSFLEYIGFRKILKSQPADLMSAETLEHAVEEGRHALRLKKLALKLGGSEFKHYVTGNMLRGEEAENYFQSLDRFCEASLSNLSESTKKRLTYLYVTLLIEIRALQVYEIYQVNLKAMGLPLALQSLLKEEESHMEYVINELQTKDPDFQNRLEIFKEKESSLFAVYLNEVRREIDLSQSLHASAH